MLVTNIIFFKVVLSIRASGLSPRCDSEITTGGKLTDAQVNFRSVTSAHRTAGRENEPVLTGCEATFKLRSTSLQTLCCFEMGQAWGSGYKPATSNTQTSFSAFRRARFTVVTISPSSPSAHACAPPRPRRGLKQHLLF